MPRGKTAYYKQTLFWGCAGAFISLASTAFGLGVSGFSLSMHLLLTIAFIPGAWSATIIGENHGLRRWRKAAPAAVLLILVAGGDLAVIRSQSISDEVRANIHMTRVEFKIDKLRSDSDGSIVGLVSGTITLRNSGQAAIKPGAVIDLGIFVISFPGLSLAGEDQLYENEHINAGCTELMQSREIFSGDEITFNCRSNEVLSDARLRGIQAGDSFIYARSRAYFSDVYGGRMTDSCLFQDGNRNRDCMSHNSTIDAFTPPSRLQQLLRKLRASL